MRMFSSPRHAFRFGLGSVLFLASFIEAKGGRLPAYEARIFRGVNGASDRLRVPVRVVMQAGTFVTVPAVSVVALQRAGGAWRPRSSSRGPPPGWVRRRRSRLRKGATRGCTWRRACSRRNHGRPGLGLGSHGGRDHPRLRRRRRGAALGPPAPARGRRDHRIRTDVCGRPPSSRCGGRCGPRHDGLRARAVSGVPCP